MGTLVVPKAKGATCFLDLKMGNNMNIFFRDLQKVANAVKAAFKADGVKIFTNNGAASGQTVFHPHFHVVPRYDGDKFSGESAKEMLKKEQADPILAKLQEALKPPPAALKKAKFGKVADIKPDSKGLNLSVKITAAPTAVESKSRTFHEVLCGDASASVVLSLTPEQLESCAEGKTVDIRNGHAVMVKNHIRVVVDKWGRIVASEDQVVDINKTKNISDT